METANRTDRLTLYVPRAEELWFRQELLADPDTMAYNAPWFPPDGCIVFPPSEWERFHARWVGREPERFYAYLRRTGDGSFAGEADFHRRRESSRWDMGILVRADLRGLGFGRQGLELLLERAFLAGGVTCLQNEFETGREAAYRIHRAAGFREESRENGIVRLVLTREEFLAGRNGR